MDNQQWLNSLKPGNEVGVYDLFGTQYLLSQIVERRTPKRIYLKGGAVYRSDGTHFVNAGSIYAKRRLKPKP